MSRPPSTEPRVRLNLEMSERFRNRLERVRDKSEADSMTETIRRAVEVYESLLDARSNRVSIIFRTEDGAEKELVLI